MFQATQEGYSQVAVKDGENGYLHQAGSKKTMYETAAGPQVAKD